MNLKSDEENVKIFCRCIMDCPIGSLNSTCELEPRAKCYRKIYLNEFGEHEIQAGCLNSVDTHIDQCNRFAHPKFQNPIQFACCDNVTLCNDHLQLPLPTLDVQTYQDSQRTALIWGLSGLGICFILLVLVVIGYRKRLKKQEELRRKQIENENKHAGCLVLTTRSSKRRCNHSICKQQSNELEQWRTLQCTSSGSGIPLLMQRTIANQIQIVKEIGRGRYGTVMLGTWREEKVALKIFNSVNEDSWHRETEIYQTVLLRHENILGFIAADICGVESVTKMYLITEYHERGSLHDYLIRNSIDIQQALKLTHSVSCGLAHLHTEITGTKGKPGIAHRDIKSKNILVKSDGQCCVADMGLAVQYSRLDEKVDLGQHGRAPTRQGTKRYMAPEVLNQSYNPEIFNAYKSMDVYSFSLVMWEVMNRIELQGHLNPYQLPYYSVTSPDPDFEEMRRIVAIGNIRPEIEQHFSSNNVSEFLD